MTFGRLLMLVGWTLAFPGAAHGVLGRRALMLAWAVAGLGAAAAVTWTVWALVGALAVRVASAVDAGLRARRFRGDEHPRLPIYASALGVAGLAYLLFATERYAIPGESMLPTIAPGDTVYIEKVTTLWSPPTRGEVIVFVHPCEQRSHIKRVVAVGGDTIEVRCGKLHVNGRAVAEPYATIPADARKDFPSLDGIVRSCRGGGPTGAIIASRDLPAAAPCDPQLHYVVPTDTLFVLGDNRASSSDSRYWGVVPLGNVTGRAIGVAWPLARAGGID